MPRDRDMRSWGEQTPDEARFGPGHYSFGTFPLPQRLFQSYDDTGKPFVLPDHRSRMAAADEPDPKVGMEVLVDTTCYGVEGPTWCRVTRLLEAWSAGVYPVKVQIPGRGEGQYKRSEIQAMRSADGG